MANHGYITKWKVLSIIFAAKHKVQVKELRIETYSYYIKRERERERERESWSACIATNEEGEL